MQNKIQRNQERNRVAIQEKQGFRKQTIEAKKVMRLLRWYQLYKREHRKVYKMEYRK